MVYNGLYHGLWTTNEGINQRNLKIWADVSDKIVKVISSPGVRSPWFISVDLEQDPYNRFLGISSIFTVIQIERNATEIVWDLR